VKSLKLGKSDLNVPAIAVGCMRMNSLDLNQANVFINEALEIGANFFDHADIYGGGECEEIFSKAIDMDQGKREKMILQSKCGISRVLRLTFPKSTL